MGRHSATPAPDAPPEVPSSGRPGAPSQRPRRHLIDRLTLAAAAAGGTGAVMAWAGAGPVAYLLGAAGTGVVVVVAAHLAGSLPGPAQTHDDGPPVREP